MFLSNRPQDPAAMLLVEHLLFISSFYGIKIK